MRNDAFDDLGDLPSLTAEPRERRSKALVAAETEAGQEHKEPRKAAAPIQRSSATGLLWTLLLAAVLALGGLAWWSHQQITQMAQQLVATQESFARISEEAAGRIQDITGKVVATESTVASGTEALKLQVRQLDGKLEALGRQVKVQAAQQDKRIEALDSQLKAQGVVADKFNERLKGLGVELGTLKGALPGEVKRLETQLNAQGEAQNQFGAQLKSLGADLQALKKQNPAQSIKRLEQELTLLRNKLESQSSPTGGTAAEFDTFRAQMTRNINALQSQVQNLQQQLNAR